MSPCDNLRTLSGCLTPGAQLCEADQVKLNGDIECKTRTGLHPYLIRVFASLVHMQIFFSSASMLGSHRTGSVQESENCNWMAFCCNPLCVCRELSETRYGIGPVLLFQLAGVRTAPSLGSTQLPEEAFLMPAACLQCFICQMMIFATVSRSESLSLYCFRFPAEGNVSASHYKLPQYRLVKIKKL